MRNQHHQRHKRRTVASTEHPGRLTKKHREGAPLNLTPLQSLAELLRTATARQPVFVMAGKLPGAPWQVTYLAGDGVSDAVVARALLEGDSAVVGSVRRATPHDFSAAYLSWTRDPHFPLLRLEHPGGAPWQAQATLIETFPITQPLRGTPDVTAALESFARGNAPDWRFNHCRVIAHGPALTIYAPDDEALAAFLRPLLLFVPSALPAREADTATSPSTTPHPRGGVNAPPSGAQRRRAPKR